jgi:hypothetical protein
MSRYEVVGFGEGFVRIDRWTDWLKCPETGRRTGDLGADPEKEIACAKAVYLR